MGKSEIGKSVGKSVGIYEWDIMGVEWEYKYTNNLKVNHGVSTDLFE